MKILCIGNASYDITYEVEKFPTENTKQRIDKKTACGGGPASTAAYLLGKWGSDVVFAGVVGNDFYGLKIKEELNQVKVDTTYLELNNTVETTLSFVIANVSNGTRTILTNRVPNLFMKNVEFKIKPDIILVDGQEYDVSLKALKDNPKAISIIDAGRPRPDVINLAKQVKYLVCSKDFAETVTEYKIDYNKQTSLTELYLKMEQLFSNNIVITLEDRGCLYKNNNQVMLMPGLKVKPIDSTGAGDIFHGAFTYGLSKGWDFNHIIKVATIAGGLSVTKVGTRNSIPTKLEMKQYDHEFE